MAHKILIVDDDTPIRELYQQLLEGEGFEIQTAADGKEGLEKITSGGFDLILLDIMMPQIDGIGILENLLEEKVKHPPILLMTNLINDPVTKEALQKGAIACLVKVSLSPEQLISTVKQTLGLQQAQTV